MPEDLAPLAEIDLPPHRSWTRGGTRPVLALHCSLAHAGAWAALADRLHGVTVTATDQPGHGRSAAWDGVSDFHALTTAQSIAMAEELGQGAPIDLFGHSFGGTVAVRVALTRPDLVRSLTLVEPVLFAVAQGTVRAAFLARHLEVARLIHAGETKAALRLFHGDWGTGEALEDLPERTRAYMADRIHLIAAQNRVLVDDTAGLLQPGRLEALRVPVLLIDGSESPPVIDAVQSGLAARLPRASRLTVPGAGHMVSITHAAEVARAVQAHLDAS